MLHSNWTNLDFILIRNQSWAKIKNQLAFKEGLLLEPEYLKINNKFLNLINW